MEQPVVTAVNDLIEWLNGGLAAAGRDRAALLRRPPGEWDEWLREDPGRLTWHLMDAMLEHAHHMLTRDPDGALASTAFVLRQIGQVRVPGHHARQLTLLHAHAWRERGNALRQSGAYTDAVEAYERSLSLLGEDPLWDAERELARRMAALTRHHMGERSGALRVIREGIAVFEETGLAGEVVRSRMYEGWIHFEEGRPREAYAIFADALANAAPLDDDAILAHLHNNLGHCLAELGESDRAIEHLVRALGLFERQGMVAERPRAVWGLARVLGETGRFEVAIGAMKQAADDLKGSGLPVDAALLWLDLLDLLLLTGRHDEVPVHASELVRTFASAQMSAEARHALALLQQTSHAPEVSAGHVAAARRQLDLLRPAAGN